MHEYVIHQETRGGLTLKIVPDDDSSESPRNWCNVSRMACRHGTYRLGDDGAESELADILCKYWTGQESQEAIADDAIGFAIRNFDKLDRCGIVAAILYLYDHSGITISASFEGGNPFSCRWDSGIVGLAWVARESAGPGRQWRAWARDRIEAEVSTYDAYLRGDIVGYVIEDEDGDHLDSCWNFYPDENGSHDYAISEGRDMLAWHCEDRAKKALARATTLRQEIRALLADLRAAGTLPPLVCGEMRAGIGRRLQDWRNARRLYLALQGE